MDFAEALPTQDEKGLRRALRQMPENDGPFGQSAGSPAHRRHPHEMPGGGAVAAALDILANSALVGLRNEPGRFQQGLAEILRSRPIACLARRGSRPCRPWRGF